MTNLTQSAQEGKRGFGLMWEHDGKIARAAVLLDPDFTPEEFNKAWDALSAMVRKPEEWHGKGVVFGEEQLAGNERDLRRS